MNIELTPEEEERYAELQRIALGFAKSGETGELSKMVAAGISTDLSDGKGQSLLMLASYNGHLDTVRMLLEMGATVDKRNDRGQTPLGGVSFKGFPEIAEILIQVGADIHADNGAGMTPIHFASMFGRFDVVSVLEQHGASLKEGQNKFRLFPMIARFTSFLRKIFQLI